MPMLIFLDYFTFRGVSSYYPMITYFFPDVFYAYLESATTDDIIRCSIPYDFQSNTGNLTFKYNTNSRTRLEVKVCADDTGTYTFDEVGWTTLFQGEIRISCQTSVNVRLVYFLEIIIFSCLWITGTIFLAYVFHYHFSFMVGLWLHELSMLPSPKSGHGAGHS